MIRSVKDIVDAVDAGRVHTQRFVKNAGVAGDNQWQDWSYASGQPAYDARIGSALAFTPAVAARNDAIFFPGIDAGMERRLLEADIYVTASGTGQTVVEFQMYDLVGYYPLIDGDNTDVQDMDNTLPLPRFATGAGIRPVLVNHVAPLVTTAIATVNYTNSAGDARVATWQTNSNGVNKVCTASLFAPLANADSGVRSIENLQFNVAPGGLWCIYLVKPLGQFYWRSGGSGITRTGTHEYNFAIKNSFMLPKIEDGAWLGYFYMPQGSARTVAMHGNLTAVWG